MPDVITTAKGIAGGLPLGAVTGRAEVMDAVPPGGLGGTYSGNPVACEAALGVLEEIERQQLVARARHIGELILATMHSLAARTDIIGDVRGRGAMIAAELVRRRRRQHARSDRDGARGAALPPGRSARAHRWDPRQRVRFPPLVIPTPLLEEGLTIVEKAFSDLQ